MEDESFNICTVTDEKGYSVVRVLNYDNYGNQLKETIVLLMDLIIERKPFRRMRNRIMMF